VYFLFIRKTKIPKLTVYIFIFAGVLIASITIPEQHQNVLTLAKRWLLPVLEFFIISTILIKIFLQIGRSRKSKNEVDSYTLIKTVVGDFFSGEKIKTLVATEIAVFYYGFL